MKKSKCTWMKAAIGILSVCITICVLYSGFCYIRNNYIRVKKVDGIENGIFYLYTYRDGNVYRVDLEKGYAKRMKGNVKSFIKGFYEDSKGSRLLYTNQSTTGGLVLTEYDVESDRYETVIEDMGKFFHETDGNYEQLAWGFEYVPQSDDVSFKINIGLSEYVANPDETEFYVYDREKEEVFFYGVLPFADIDDHYIGYKWGADRNRLYLCYEKAIYEYHFDTNETKFLMNYPDDCKGTGYIADDTTLYYVAFDTSADGKEKRELRRYRSDLEIEDVICEGLFDDVCDINVFYSLQLSPDEKYMLIDWEDQSRYDTVVFPDGSFTTADIVLHYLDLINNETGESYSLLEWEDIGSSRTFWKGK